jgi:phenylacetic acid degradation operon negative regulatory protein
MLQSNDTVRPQTEALLYFLLCSADSLMRPTWRNLNESFESWAWRNGLGRRLVELERQNLLERHPEPNLSRVVRLTEAGKRLALGGRDPIAQWSRSWDGQWRLVIFDLPTDRVALRRKLLRVLRSHQFGYLQNSVWVTPDPAINVRATLGEAKAQPETFLVLEGRPAAGETDREIVASAWNFVLINRRYEQYFLLHQKSPPIGPRLSEWCRRENAAWKAATHLDPFLPASLLPPGYLGNEAFQRRKVALAYIASSVPSVVA